MFFHYNRLMTDPLNDARQIIELVHLISFPSHLKYVLHLNIFNDLILNGNIEIFLGKICLLITLEMSIKSTTAAVSAIMRKQQGTRQRLY